MSIDDMTTQLRGQLQEAFGVDGATYLMDRPPGGWSDLVTNETLRLELRAVSAEFRAELGTVRHELGAEIASVRFEIGSVRSELGAEIASVHSEISSVRSELGAEIASVHSEISSVRSEISALGHELRAEIANEARGQTWRLMTAMLSVMAFFTAVMAALIKL